VLRVVVRPRWIAALFGALLVAGVFAALGQWQLERSIAEATVVERDTENAVALDTIATPQEVMSSDASGRMVTVSCVFIAGDDVVVQSRQSLDGSGSWLVRHCKTESGASLAVVLGWSDKAIEVDAISNPKPPLVGRYVPSESPQQSDFRSGERTAIAIAELLNLWDNPGPVYSGYLVATVAPAGLLTIGTEPPPTERQLNWLNLFYAAEWAIFAVFALYLWYRLVRDAWERELREAASDAP
jgi:surfeit locus 1 family protein